MLKEASSETTVWPESVWPNHVTWPIWRISVCPVSWSMPPLNG